MKKIGLAMLVLFLMCGCSQTYPEQSQQEIRIELSDDQMLIHGPSETSSVTFDEKIIYYESGHDETYGEGTQEDAHSKEEAELHTVVTIKEAGVYRVTGSLSHGQIVVDLGEDAKNNPEEKVTLILDDVNLTCTVAPAILVVNTYECAEETKENPSVNADLSNAGFTLVLSDGSVNTINGSYVAKIYEPGTDKKLVKYDAAIESLVSLIIKGNGTLNVTAEKEGIETKMHMHIQSGNLSVNSYDDSLNAGEDGVSVLRISGGTVVCNATLGDEGDGIDSNGWLVIEGGTVAATANAKSQDSGLDSDNGILIHGGNVLASGNMFDQISNESKQLYMVLNMPSDLTSNTMLGLKQNDEWAAVLKPEAGSVVVFSSDVLKKSDYTLWTVSEAAGNWNETIMIQIEQVTENEQLYQHSSMGWMGRPQGMMNPEHMDRPEDDFDDEMRGQRLEGNFDPSQMQRPEDFGRGDIPDGRPDENSSQRPQDPDFNQMPQGSSEVSDVFSLSENQNSFMIVQVH